MKRLILGLLTAGCVYAAHPAMAQTPNPDYNPALADSLDADPYGMRWYVLVLLHTGPTVMDDAERRATLFAGHMQAIQTLAAEGKLIVAGPIESNPDALRGLFVLKTESLEEASSWLEIDPTVREGLLAPTLVRWYGSAALPVYLDVHQQIQQYRIP